MAIDNPQSSTNLTLLLKELDIIQDTIKNLDDIIYKTKNFAFLAWGGSLYLFTEQFKEIDETYRALLYGLTAIIPLLFWVMDFRWRIHLLRSSKRERIISRFINSPVFELWQLGNNLPPDQSFPLYDPVGCIYFTKASGKVDPENVKFSEQYLIDNRNFGWLKVAFYKDAYIFYGTLVLMSLILSTTYFFVL